MLASLTHSSQFNDKNYGPDYTSHPQQRLVKSHIRYIEV